MSRFMRQPKRYRGTDGVMRTLAETAAFMGITVDELRLRWFGTKMPNHVRNDGKYHRCVQRRILSERK
jgi:hypothetical protein